MKILEVKAVFNVIMFRQKLEPNCGRIKLRTRE